MLLAVCYLIKTEVQKAVELSEVVEEGSEGMILSSFSATEDELVTGFPPITPPYSVPQLQLHHQSLRSFISGRLFHHQNTNSNNNED